MVGNPKIISGSQTYIALFLIPGLIFDMSYPDTKVEYRYFTFSYYKHMRGDP